MTIKVTTPPDPAQPELPFIEPSAPESPMDDGDVEYTGQPPADSPTYTNLVSALQARVSERFSEVDATPALAEQFALALAEEIDHLLEKFTIGQRKHGGNILERDLKHELNQEIRDAFIYMVCERLQHRMLHLYV